MIIVVKPAPPPKPPYAPPPRLMATWTSWTGDAWEITNPASPLFTLQGATGLGGAGVEHRWADAVSLNGSTWDGVRVARGEVFLPMRIDGATVDDFLATESAFMRSLDPVRESTLRITRPDGQWRESALRYVSGMDAPIELDPLLVRRATYGVTWAAADPFWQGAPVVVDFPYTTGTGGFFPGPPFRIGPSRSTNHATVTNPGDVEVFPVWRVTGPFTGFTVGVGDSVVSVTKTIAAGQWVEIDLDPRRLTVVDQAGADLWDAVTDFSRATIPPGDTTLTTNLQAAQVGAAVRLTFTPRYWRAW